MQRKEPARWELLIAGVGGWGIVTMGDILAKAALRKYEHVVWFPSYATQMRGGESECCVIFSDQAIPSPLVYRSKVVMVLGAWRTKAFEDRVHPQGVMLIDTTEMKEEYKVMRNDIKVKYVPAVQTAIRLGNMRNANLVMLGAYIGLTRALPPQFLLEEIEKRFGGEGREAAVLTCKRAFQQGMSLMAGLGDQL